MWYSTQKTTHLLNAVFNQIAPQLIDRPWRENGARGEEMGEWLRA